MSNRESWKTRQRQGEKVKRPLFSTSRVDTLTTPSACENVFTIVGNMIEGSSMFGWEKTFLGNLGHKPTVYSVDRAQKMEQVRTRPVRLFCATDDCDNGIRGWTTAFGVLDALGVLVCF